MEQIGADKHSANTGVYPLLLCDPSELISSGEVKVMQYYITGEPSGIPRIPETYYTWFSYNRYIDKFS
jgi:hypothetical protein